MRPGRVQADLSMLMTLDRNSLAKRWVATFECSAPRSCQATLLRLALGWHAQMQALRESVGSREADRAAQSLKRAASTSPGTGLSPGTRLLREWQGTTHHVTVLSSGFEYGGQTYRSLTAIARAITGSSWSGPLFFGLRT
ncbi:MAG: DUF2924 domain-containing protein [Pseudomonadota bacterium]|nr:DUF2924 domain-containing protein [Pseudomonadota bacterium]